MYSPFRRGLLVECPHWLHQWHSPWKTVFPVPLSFAFGPSLLPSLLTPIRCSKAWSFLLAARSWHGCPQGVHLTDLRVALFLPILFFGPMLERVVVPTTLTPPHNWFGGGFAGWYLGCPSP